MAIAKLPRQLCANLYRFAPNRDTLGGTAYLIIEATGNILIDCPPWDETLQQWLNPLGPVRWLCLTHRDGHSPQLAILQRELGCQVIVQEQEAYLLPQIDEINVCRFQNQHQISSTLTALWTPGHSPGSTCYYWSDNGGILFTGRHLLPDQAGHLSPIRQPKTFHWLRQQASVKKLWDYVADQPLQGVCPGGNIGYLRGQAWLTLPKSN